MMELLDKYLLTIVLVIFCLYLGALIVGVRVALRRRLWVLRLVMTLMTVVMVLVVVGAAMIETNYWFGIDWI